jgi:hypothetical protein
MKHKCKVVSFQDEMRKSQETFVRMVEIEPMTSLLTIRCALSVTVSVGVDLSTDVLECVTLWC